MRIIILSLAVGALVLGAFVTPTQVQAESQSQWTVKDSMVAKVNAFVQTSPVLEGMRQNNVPNDMVYGVNDPNKPILPIYELLACLQLTNPGAFIEFYSGGGYNIDIDAVIFPGGTWNVSLRLREVEQIDMLDKRKVYLIDRLVVGTLQMRDLNQRVQAMRQMSRACYADPRKG